MLLGDSDRDEICELLSRHAALGRLSLEELERRVGQVMSAESREQAVVVLADLPPLPTDERRSSRLGSRRRHGQADQPRADWTPTEERFRDPRSGGIVRVWSDPSGGRHYVPDE
jgi:hypothetical protein